MQSDDPYALILHRLDEIDKRLDEVLVNVKATNGRVTTLEKWQARLEGGKDALSFFRGATMIVVAGVSVAVMVGLVQFAATH